MTYSFTLKHNDTIVTYNDTYDYKDESHMLYMWLEGNYSCDCNRYMFMYNDYETDFPCGESIELLSITDANGHNVNYRTNYDCIHN